VPDFKLTLTRGDKPGEGGRELPVVTPPTSVVISTPGTLRRGVVLLVLMLKGGNLSSFEDRGGDCVQGDVQGIEREGPVGSSS